MVKLIVFSDSHGHVANMEAAAKLHPDADCFLFLGDGKRDFEHLRDANSLPAFMVRGNCDFSAGNIPETAILDFEGCKIMLTHGHLYGVKYSLSDLIYAGRERGADLILFGHTHIPYTSYIPFENGEKPIHLLNPGSISMPSYKGCTYGVVQIKKEADGKFSLLTNIAVI